MPSSDRPALPVPLAEDGEDASEVETLVRADVSFETAFGVNVPDDAVRAFPYPGDDRPVGEVAGKLCAVGGELPQERAGVHLCAVLYRPAIDHARATDRGFHNLRIHAPAEVVDGDKRPALDECRGDGFVETANSTLLRRDGILLFVVDETDDFLAEGLPGLRLIGLG